MNNIYKALNEIKQELGKVQRTGNNPHFKSKYMTLAGIYEAIGNKFTEKGLTFIQYPEYKELDNKPLPILTTVISDDSGKELRFETPFIGVGNMQQLGGAITYARRYSIVSLLGILETDDDYETAMDRKKDFPKIGRSPEQQRADYNSAKGGL